MGYDEAADGTGATSPPSVRSNLERVKSLYQVEAGHITLSESRWKFICPPRQRHKWGEKQGHPHVDWGDIFFDLFYVAAAYNLAGILKETSDLGRGLLYFFGTFGPVYLFWFEKMNFDARYVRGQDLFHSLTELVHLGFLAAAVLNIRPVDMMSEYGEKAEMFAFSLSMSLGACGNVMRYIEVWIWGVGEPASKESAKKEMRDAILPVLCFVLAALESGMALFGDHIRQAGDLPIILCLTGWVFYMMATYTRILLLYPNNEDLKNNTIPMNVEYVMHRYGEWTMLMLGESVLSLLIIEASEGLHYYISFFAGVVSVTWLQYLHFKSQPYHAEDHCLVRSKNAAATFAMIMQVYSAALIILGGSYKMIVSEYVYSTEKEEAAEKATADITEVINEEYRESEVDVEENTYFGVPYGPDGSARFLADAYAEDNKEVSDYYKQEKQLKIATLFCVSMAVVFLCLDIMILCHTGFRRNVKRLNLGGVALTALRLGVVVFIGTVWIYFTNPELLAVIGLGCVLTQICIRGVGTIIFPAKSSGVEGEGNANESFGLGYPGGISNITNVTGV